MWNNFNYVSYYIIQLYYAVVLYVTIMLYWTSLEAVSMFYTMDLLCSCITVEKNFSWLIYFFLGTQGLFSILSFSLPTLAVSCNLIS